MMALAAYPADMTFSYNPEGNPTRGFGYDKEETYDVAILLDAPSLIGTTITGLEVELPGADKISEVCGWLSSTLDLKRVNGKYVNNPDITTAEGTLKDGVLKVTFPEGHVIDGTLYAGYSFTVTGLDDATGAPVMVSDGAREGGLYIHSSRTKLKWGDVTGQANGVSVLKVNLTGDFADNSAAFRIQNGLYTSIEGETVLPLAVENHGGNQVKSVAYIYSVAGNTGSGSIEFETPIAAAYGASTTAEINLGTIAAMGDQELSITITEVNGQPNGDKAATTAIPLRVYPFLAVNRPLVEEYTGLWCGYCPRGYVALETMKELYPDQFVGIAYHSGDDMSTEVDFPNSPDGFPAGFINRNRENINLAKIYDTWPAIAATLAPCDIEVNVEWTDDSHSAVKATSTSRFLSDQTNADYGVSYVLVIDRLSDPSWKQSNYYAPAEGAEPQDNPDMPGDWGYLFTHGTNPMTGLEFNDVALASSGSEGMAGSIPAAITAGEEYSHVYTFDIASLPEKATALINQHPALMRVIGIIMDRKTGRAVNCVSSLNLNGESGVAEAAMEQTVIVETIYFDLQGRRVACPERGIYIKADVYSDGSCRTSKYIR